MAGTLDVSTLEGWLWDAACQIRGPLDAPKFKDYILPLVFLKRLSDVFEDEVAKLGDQFGDRATAAKLVEEDHSLVRFHLPEMARRTVPCPKCGSRLLPIEYGYPGPSMMDAYSRGEIALGGCAVTDRDPDLQCSGCQQRFFSDELKQHPRSPSS